MGVARVHPKLPSIERGEPDAGDGILLAVAARTITSKHDGSAILWEPERLAVSFGDDEIRGRTEVEEATAADL